MRMIWFINLEQHIKEAETYRDPVLCLQLGRLNERGCAIKKDLNKARYWYQMAADGGNGEAMYRLSLFKRVDKYNTRSEEAADDLLDRSIKAGYFHKEEPIYTVEAFITIASLMAVIFTLYFFVPTVISLWKIL